jgi:hypothetical protein
MALNQAPHFDEVQAGVQELFYVYRRKKVNGLLLLPIY